MRRSHAALGLAVIVIATAIAVGCQYRGYFAGLLPSAAAEVSDITLPPGFRITVYARGAERAPDGARPAAASCSWAR